MTVDLRKFFQACNPSKTLNTQHSQDRDLYVNFAEVRGAAVINELKRDISWSGERSCNLFTGHVGCGKSTELLCLRTHLEAEDFHTIYCDQIERGDLEVSDILLAIAHQVSQSLKQANIALVGSYFKNLYQECQEFLTKPRKIDMNAELSLWGMGKLRVEAQDDPSLRSQLRQFLEPQVPALIKAINREIIYPAHQTLRQRGKQGLVVIMDNLDRIDRRRLDSGETLPEYLFIKRGEHLTGLNCHLVYTMPLSLRFARERQTLEERVGNITVLPMVPVHLKDGSVYAAGLEKLREMIWHRALTACEPGDRPTLMAQLFDDPDTLDYICLMSGGHVRNLLRLMQACLRKHDTLPIKRANVEQAVQEERAELMLSITSDAWELLRKVQRTQAVNGDVEQDTVLRNLWAFEYRHQGNQWFAVNPFLAGVEQLRDSQT